MQRLCRVIADSVERASLSCDLLMLLLVAICVIFPGLGQTQYLAIREIRHAEIIREMAENRDYIVPHLLGKVYPDKPPVMHSLAAKFTQWWGEPSFFFARLPSALAAIGVVLATYGLGRVMYGRWPARVGALVLLSFPGFSIMARQVRPDMILCLAIMACSLALALGMRENRRTQRGLWFVAAGAAAGLGVVTKGPYGLLFPVLFVALAAIRRPEWRRPRFGWLGFAAALLGVAALWAVPAYLRDGGHYLRQVIFQKDLDVTEHASAWYILIAPAIFLSLPVGLFLPMAVRDWRRHGYSAPLACAAAVLMVVQAVPKKRAHYLLPMYPFLALGVAATFVRHAADSKRLRRLAGAAVLLGMAITPLYFGVLMRWFEHAEDTNLRAARAVLAVLKPETPVYLLNDLHEHMAWVGRDHSRVLRLDFDDPQLAATLRAAPSGSYLILTKSRQKQLEGITGPLPMATVGLIDWPRNKFDSLLDPPRPNPRQVMVLEFGTPQSN